MPLQLCFATGNKGKFNEAKAFLEKEVPGLHLKQCSAELVELQADTLEAVARFKVEGAIKSCKGNVFIEDAGLFVPALNGFPGIFSAEVKKMLDCKGILKLMEEFPNASQRDAYFQACTCLYLRETREIKMFIGRIDGIITFEERGNQGFGFDPIFVPGEPSGNTRTFAEMGIEEKNEISHRAKALRELKDFLLSLA
ncbi:MAG TPA: RdgB/HAM1 family non-canonical purine NTP pyrophosphatase [Candidatus Lokiarchaeia archaeon]|nr:RdgB/HAM1 family non-canonical purine NTP pyrophosphatase [Candidatus Lokiarchaeia archaeon]